MCPVLAEKVGLVRSFPTHIILWFYAVNNSLRRPSLTSGILHIFREENSHTLPPPNWRGCLLLLLSSAGEAPSDRVGRCSIRGRGMRPATAPAAADGRSCCPGPALRAPPPPRGLGSLLPARLLRLPDPRTVGLNRFPWGSGSSVGQKEEGTVASGRAGGAGRCGGKRGSGARGAALRAPLRPAECEHERRGWRWAPGGCPQLRPPLHPLQQTPGLAFYQPGRLRDRVLRPSRRLEGPGGPEMPAGAAARQVTGWAGGRRRGAAPRQGPSPARLSLHPSPERVEVPVEDNGRGFWGLWIRSCCFGRQPCFNSAGKGDPHEDDSAWDERKHGPAPELPLFRSLYRGGFDLHLWNTKLFLLEFFSSCTVHLEPFSR